jgi:hypothetical protein
MENEAPVVSVRIADSRLRVRLKGGPRFRRQRDAIEHMVNGDATRGELALYQQGTDIMCKIVAWLPRPENFRRDERAGTLRIRTDAKSLIVAADGKDERVWVYHGDHIRRWSAEHRTQLQRWSDDEKAEHRPAPPFAARRQAAAVKYRHRMDSACHQISAAIAGYACRRKYAAVRYDDVVQEFCDGFPWFRLRALIAEKLDAAGLEFEHATAGTTEPKQV